MGVIMALITPRIEYRIRDFGEAAQASDIPDFKFFQTLRIRSAIFGDPLFIFSFQYYNETRIQKPDHRGIENKKRKDEIVKELKWAYANV